MAERRLREPRVDEGRRRRSGGRSRPQETGVTISRIAILGKRFSVRPPGWDEVAPKHPTLGDVESPEDLAAYQAGKRARKAELRAAGQRNR